MIYWQRKETTGRESYPGWLHIIQQSKAEGATWRCKGMTFPNTYSGIWEGKDTSNSINSAHLFSYIIQSAVKRMQNFCLCFLSPCFTIMLRAASQWLLLIYPSFLLEGGGRLQFLCIKLNPTSMAMLSPDMQNASQHPRFAFAFCIPRQAE